MWAELVAGKMQVVSWSGHSAPHILCLNHSYSAL